VRVAVLLPGAIDNNIVRQASRSKFGGLLKAGIEVYEYQAGLLHAKTMTIERRLGDDRKHQSGQPLLRAQRGAQLGGA
jgi:phosphatidylserine/phosphatidylglycerophosphate/cardiolipin synthase-like enzyme